MRPDDATLRTVLAAGILAPSAENKHHLLFRLVEGAVELLTTDQGSWAARPHRRLLCLMALGAVIENVALESRAAGLELAADTRGEASRPELVARLTWLPTRAPPDPLRERLASRHTNRRFFARKVCAPATLERLAAAAAAVDGCSVTWLATASQRRLALRAIRIAETERFRRPALHDELFGAVRFELGWKQPSEEWLAPAALEVEPPMRLPFAAMRRWPLMQAANLVGAHHAFGLRAGYLPSAGAPHLGLIVATGPEAWARDLAAGRAFQRLWLAADAHGLALQPMAAATALARQVPGGGWVSQRAQDDIRQALDQLTPGPDAEPCMFFRLGRAAPPSARALRRPVEAYITR